MAKVLFSVLVAFPLAVILSFAAYVFAPLALGMIWMIVAIKPLADSSRSPAHRLRAALAAVGCATLLFLGFLAAVHALLLLILGAAGAPELHPLHASWWNLPIAAIGLFLGYLGARMVFALAYELRKLVLLRPTPVSDVRLGLHEIRGTARAIRESVPLVDARGPDAAFPEPPAGALLHFAREERWTGRGRWISRVVSERWTVRRFVVEDAGGRLLVDPEGVRPWMGAESAMWERFSKALLTGRVQREDLPGGGVRETRTLVAGDPVHLVGWVSRNPDVADDEPGPERFLMRLSDAARKNGRALPVSGIRWDVANLVPRCREAAAHALQGESPKDVFLLSDAEEIRIRSHFIRAIRQAGVVVAVWILLPLWLVKDTVAHAPYRDWTPREIVQQAPPEQREALLDRSLGTRETRRRYETVSAQARRASTDPEAARSVISSLDDPDARVRREAAAALPRMPIAGEAVPRLLDAIDRGDSEIARHAALAIQRTPADPETVMRSLSRSLGRKDLEGMAVVDLSRVLASYAKRTGRPAPELVTVAVPRLVEIAARHYRVHMLDVHARGALTPIAELDGPGTVAQLGQTLTAANTDLQNDSARLVAVEVLPKLGEPARLAIPALAQAGRTDPSARVRKAALRAIRALDPSPATLLPAIEAGLRDSDRGIRSEALRLVIGPPALAIPPSIDAALLPMISDPDPTTRRLAITLLLRGEGTRVGAMLDHLQQSDRPEAQKEVVASMRPLGPKAAAAVPALIDCLCDADPERRRLAVEALTWIGPAAKEAVPALMLHYDCSVGMEKQAAATAIRQITGALPASPPAREPPRPLIPSAAPVVHWERVSSSQWYSGWMSRAPSFKGFQAIPIRTEKELRSAAGVLGVGDFATQQLAERLKSEEILLLTGVRSVKGQRVGYPKLYERQDGAGWRLVILEDLEPSTSSRATQYPWVLLPIPARKVPLLDCVDPDGRELPWKIRSSFVLP